MSNKKDPNREAAQQRLNMGQDPGGSFADLNSKYRQQQATKQAQQSGRSGGCFPSGTMISTSSGQRDIASIQPGTHVLSVDITTGEPMPSRVLSVRHHAARNIWRIALEDEAEVRTTASHSFRLADGWKRASRVCPGDKVLFYDMQGRAQVKTVVNSYSACDVDDVFNLIVERHFNFIADGALAHSFTYFRHAQMIAWQILALCTYRGGDAYARSTV